MRVRPSGPSRSRLLVGACLLGAAAFGILFVVVFWATNSTRLEGISLGLCFALLTVALVVWAKRDMPEGPYEESYPELRSGAHQEAEVLATLHRGGLGRRRFLLGALGLAGGSVVAGAVSVIRSLGPGPYFFSGSPWGAGKRLVTQDGTPVHAADVPVDSFVVVFPEGFTDSPFAPAMLIRVPPNRNVAQPGRASWDPDGFLCYSRVCTHAGCSVGQFDAVSYQLQCPCHQSVFDVLRGAVPVFGPATRELPQLPLAIEADGTFRARGGFSGPIGPDYWYHT